MSSALIVGVIAATACGESSDDEVERMLTDYYKAYSRGDGKAVCAQQTARLRAAVVRDGGKRSPRLRRESCAEVIAAGSVIFPAPLDDDDIEIDDIEVNDQTATATVRVSPEYAPGDDAEERVLERVTLEKDGDDWKMSRGVG